VKRRFYSSGEFARKAKVSVRTVRYYDQVGLLSPTQHTDAGYRLYGDADFATLQQILALKFLGFSLEEIRRCLLTGPRHLPAVLAQQKAMLREKRAQLDTIVAAIERAESLLQSGQCSWDSIIRVIEVMQVEKKSDWVDTYFTPEQRQKMEELSQASYSEAARQKLAARSPQWTEEDQKRVDAQWGWVNAEIKRLMAAGADPAGPEAQSWAKVRSGLLHEFSQGDPEIEAGLRKWWQNFQALPDDQRPMQIPQPSKEELEFTQKAMSAYKQSTKDAS